MNTMVNKEIKFLSKIRKILHSDSNLLKGNEDAIAINTSDIKKSKTIYTIQPKIQIWTIMIKF